MNIETIRDFCLQKKGKVTEELPFGNDTLVFKVSGKIFLLVSMNTRPLQFNAKCDPERAIELRERFASIRPGYHMNKKHWNTVIINGELTAKEIFSLIDHSYELVAKSLKKNLRSRL